MKVTVPFIRTFRIWLVSFLIGAALIFLCFSQIFLREWDFVQPLIITIFVLVMIVLLVLAVKLNYYEVNKKYLIQHKFNKDFIYYYSDVIYIDRKSSEKSKTLSFVTKNGHTMYLAFDKEGYIYKTMICECKNLVSYEELQRKFPNIKI